MTTPRPRVKKPQAVHLGVSAYPAHFDMLDDIRQHLGGASRSRAVQYLIELYHTNINTNTNRSNDDA